MTGPERPPTTPMSPIDDTPGDISMGGEYHVIRVDDGWVIESPDGVREPEVFETDEGARLAAMRRSKSDEEARRAK